VAIGKLLPILMYGPELHTKPPEESSRLAATISRWVVMGYRGSSKEKIEDISGIRQLEVLTHRKRVRWAASVYSRHEPSLRPRAQKILEEELGEEVDLRWMEGVTPGERQKQVKILEKTTERGELEPELGRIGYTDGSRMKGAAAGASAEGGLFLGTYATVMDAEMVGIAGAWEEGYEIVAVDSQAAIRRCENLMGGVNTLFIPLTSIFILDMCLLTVLALFPFSFVLYFPLALVMAEAVVLYFTAKRGRKITVEVSFFSKGSGYHWKGRNGLEYGA